MSSSGYLVPPSHNPSHEKLWTQTWDRLNDFLPGLFTYLFPEEQKKEQQRKEEEAKEEDGKEIKSDADKASGGVSRTSMQSNQSSVGKSRVSA